MRGIFSILPEDEVALVAADSTINAAFLDYLSRLFEDNQRILSTILYNPSSSADTREHILEGFPDATIFSMAGDANAPGHLLRSISECCKATADVQVNLLANPSTPEELKEAIIAESSEEIAHQELEAISPEDFAMVEPVLRKLMMLMRKLRCV